MLLPSGKVLVTASGPETESEESDASPTLPAAHLYDPVTDTWRVASDHRVPSWVEYVLPLASGKLLLVGGRQSDPGPGRVEVFEP